MRAIWKTIHQLKLGRTLHLVWKSGPRWTLANVALQIVQGLLPLVSLYLMKLLIDAVTASLTTADKAVALRQVIILIGLSGVVALVGVLCRSLGLAEKN